MASAGGADALVTMLKSNARHHRDGAVYALAGLMDRNVDAVRHAFAHSQGQSPPTALSACIILLCCILQLARVPHALHVTYLGHCSAADLEALFCPAFADRQALRCTAFQA